LDLMLPDGSGVDALHFIRSMEKHRRTPVIVVTHIAEAQVPASTDIQGYVSKPVDRDRLLAALESCGIPRRNRG
jgi:CheY-like chemotaxis protein